LNKAIILIRVVLLFLIFFRKLKMVDYFKLLIIINKLIVKMKIILSFMKIFFWINPIIFLIIIIEKSFFLVDFILKLYFIFYFCTFVRRRYLNNLINHSIIIIKYFIRVIFSSIIFQKQFIYVNVIDIKRFVVVFLKLILHLIEVLYFVIKVNAKYFYIFI
jgi:hypothetical protein